MRHLPNTEKDSKSMAGRLSAADSVRRTGYNGESLYPPAQRKPNDTGLPDPLKENMEQTSGYSLDDVKVHYNSGKPAQLNALAYAQGADIHVGPGQEKHLPHEAWHVVQQKQGRVKPTRQLKEMVNINDDAGLEKEANVMGLKVAGWVSTNRSDTQKNESEIRTSNGTAQAIIQREVNLATTLNISNIKKIKVSTGGGTGVVFIPSVVAKLENEPQAAIDTAMSINSLLGDVKDQRWSVDAPTARKASPDEARAIEQKLYAKNKNKPGSVGDPDRVTRTVNLIQENINKIVLYEEASGEDFIKHLAEGPEKSDPKKDQTNRRGNKLKKGRGLDLLATPAYARQLGRVAAIDIFMGNKDRLQVKGNFGNWMSNSRSKKITLIDNEITTMSKDTWADPTYVNSLATGQFLVLAEALTTTVQAELFETGFGGGKLNDQEQKYWTNNIRKPFVNNIADGLQEGKAHIMNKGRSLIVKLKASQSPLGNVFEERLDYFDGKGN